MMASRQLVRLHVYYNSQRETIEVKLTCYTLILQMLIQEKACPKSKTLAIKHAVASLMRNVVQI